MTQGNSRSLQAVLIQKGTRQKIEMGWILLDNHSTADVFSNSRLVQNICHSGRSYIAFHLNARKCRVMKESILEGYGTVWFDQGAITNILSFSGIGQNYPVRYDTEGNFFYIMKPDKEFLFRKSQSGVYFHNTSDQYVVLVNTISEIRGGFSQKQYDGANKQQLTLDIVGYPSEKKRKIRCMLE